MINLGPLDIDYDRFLFSEAVSTDDEQLDQSEENVAEGSSNDDLEILDDVVSIVNLQKSQSPIGLNQEAMAVAKAPADVVSRNWSNRELVYLAALAASLIFISATTAWLLWKPSPSPEVFKMALVVQPQQTTTPSGNEQTNQVRSPDGTNSSPQLSDAMIRIESNSAARVFFIQGGNESAKVLAGSLDLPENDTGATLTGNDRMSFRLKSFDVKTPYFAIVTPPNTERESVEALVDKVNRTGMTEQALMNGCLTHVPKFQCLTIAMP